MTDVALVHLVPSGKKGLNLWLNAIPVPASLVIFNHYAEACRAHMGIYSLRSEKLTVFEYDPAGLQGLRETEPPPEWGAIFFSSSWLILLSCAPPWSFRTSTGRLVLPLLCHRGADLVVLIIEFIIPADKHAVQLEAPPAPPAPPALPEPNPNVDPQLSATRDAAPKGGGLLQSFGITMGGMQDDPVTAATFLEAGTLHVHLARSAARTGRRVCAARLQAQAWHCTCDSRALTGECYGAQVGRSQWQVRSVRQVDAGGTAGQE